MLHFLLACSLLLAGPTSAGAFNLSDQVVGRVSVFTNDYLGDGRDRWRSGSYFRSTFFGPAWTGDLPTTRPLIEFRLRGETIAPSDISALPSAGERPYVGVVAAGVFGHWARGATGVKLGAELVATGPQTGVARFVERSHDALGFSPVRATSGQLADGFYPTISGEVYRLIARSRQRSFDLRPFVEVQAGVETLARAGVDLIFGTSADGALLTRDPVTGHLLTVATVRRQQGLMPSMGADVAYVQSSAYLPASSGVQVKHLRMRARAGARYVAGGRDLFVGFAWLGPEYESQPSGQVVGSLSFNYRF